MTINKKITASFSFSPDDYFLVLQDSRGMGKEFSLNYRINRSEKGKDDDIGMPVIYLADLEAEIIKRDGFDYIEL